MLPLRITFAVVTSLLKARGDFRRWAVVALCYGLGLVVVAIVAGMVSSHPAAIAAWIAGYFMIGTPLILVVSLQSLDVGWRQLALTTVPPWLLGLLCLIVCVALDRFVFQGHQATTRFGLLAGTFVVLFVTCARLLLLEAIEDTLSILPRPIARAFSVLLRVRRFE
jgi:hypothetical protein